MRQSDFYPLMRAKPFVPFRIVRSNGTIYSIDTPRMILPLVDGVVLFMPHPLSSRLDGPIYDIPLSEVIKVETVSADNGIHREMPTEVGS
jgi:hypothetical protein